MKRMDKRVYHGHKQLLIIIFLELNNATVKCDTSEPHQIDITTVMREYYFFSLCCFRPRILIETVYGLARNCIESINKKEKEKLKASQCIKSVYQVSFGSVTHKHTKTAFKIHTDNRTK